MLDAGEGARATSDSGLQAPASLREASDVRSVDLEGAPQHVAELVDEHAARAEDGVVPVAYLTRMETASAAMV